MDLNEERARWATESANVARSLSRLADLTLLVGLDGEGVNVAEMNDLAARLHSWAQRVARDLGKPELAEDLARRQQALSDWRKLTADVRSGSRRREV